MAKKKKSSNPPGAQDRDRPCHGEAWQGPRSVNSSPIEILQPALSRRKAMEP